MPTPFTGPAGEHYILFRLLQKEYIAGLAPQNAPNQDIIATNKEGTKAAAIQVKTRRPLGRDGGWSMKEKHEALAGDRMFYCFVDLKEEDVNPPDIYIIPARVVAGILKETNDAWLAEPGRMRQQRKATDMRRLLPDYSHLELNGEQMARLKKGWMEKYKENWSILGLD